MDCIPEGFKAMVAAILILTLAWTIKTMTDSLGAADFVAGLVKSGAESFMNFLPAVVFLVGCGLAFATGTSWGTFEYLSLSLWQYLKDMTLRWRSSPFQLVWLAL